MFDLKAVEALLYDEARVMDEHRYSEWLEMWSSDAVYWVPCRHEAVDPNSEVSIIFDDRRKLTDRVERLLSGSVLAQEPAPRMRRLISNIVVNEPHGSEADVSSNFLLVQATAAGQVLWCGRTVHRLVHAGDRILIARKTVYLVNSEHELPLLQFII